MKKIVLLLIFLASFSHAYVIDELSKGMHYRNYLVVSSIKKLGATSLTVDYDYDSYSYDFSTPSAYLDHDSYINQISIGYLDNEGRSPLAKYVKGLPVRYDFTYAVGWNATTYSELGVAVSLYLKPASQYFSVFVLTPFVKAGAFLSNEDYSFSSHSNYPDDAEGFGYELEAGLSLLIAKHVEFFSSFSIKNAYLRRDAYDRTTYLSGNTYVWSDILYTFSSTNIAFGLSVWIGME